MLFRKLKSRLIILTKGIAVIIIHDYNSDNDDLCLVPRDFTLRESRI